MAIFPALAAIQFSFGDFSISFLSILLEGVPFVLIGTMMSGLVDAFLPPKAMERILPRSGLASVLVSGLLGLVFPMCECGVVPVIRRLIGKGLPVSCALTYMLSAPIVNPIVIVTTIMAFRGNQPDTMVFLRLAIGYAVAVTVGMITLRTKISAILKENVIKTLPEHRFGDLARVDAELPAPQAHGHGHGHDHGHVHGPDCDHDHDDHDHDHHEHDHDHVHHDHEHGQAHLRPGDRERAAAHDHHEHHAYGMKAKLAHALQAGTQDFLDVTFYLIIGASITAVFNTALKQSSLEVLGTTPVLSTFVLEALAFVLSLCSSSDAFVAATLAVFPLSAKLAFLVFGPMVDVKLLMLYSTVFKRRFIIVLCIGLFVAIGLICSALDPALAQAGPTASSQLEATRLGN